MYIHHQYKTQKENLSVDLHSSGPGNGFLDKTTKVQVTIAKKIGKLDTIKIKTLCAQEDNVKKGKDKSQSGRKYFQVFYLTRLLQEYINNYLIVRRQKSNF